MTATPSAPSEIDDTGFVPLGRGLCQVCRKDVKIHRGTGPFSGLQVCMECEYSA